MMMFADAAVVVVDVAVKSLHFAVVVGIAAVYWCHIKKIIRYTH